MKINYSKFILVTFFLSICIATTYSQHSFVRVVTLPVQVNGNFISNPWVGGHNFSQLSAIDLNQDGIKDLFVFDRAGNRISTYINNGTPNSVDYEFAPEYISKFPDLHDWVLLADYNCDGKEDIFTYSNGGMAVYRNDWDTPNGFHFTLITNLVMSYYNPSTANLYITSVDIPAITDVDNDGDLDVLTFSILGSFVEFHKNNSIELYGNCDSLKYGLDDGCWGKFAESPSSNSVLLNQSCKGGYDNPANLSDNEILHTGSSLLALDLDGDTDKELILGDVSYSNMTMVTNGGTLASAYITAQDNAFPSNTTPVNLNIFPAAFYLDVDNDNIKDLIVSTNAANVSENFNSILYYKNNNTTDSPLFNYEMNDFLQKDMIDVGEGAYPVLFDYDSDGDWDLFVGNYGYYSAGSNYQSKIALFKNTGTASNPVFDLITRDYANISAQSFTNVYPAFGDIDGDSDADMIIGEQEGRVHYYENIAGAGTPPNYVLTTSSYFGIDVGQCATPQIIDINRDGKLDLLIGERNGTLNYFRNIGTVNAPDYSNMYELFGNVNVTAPGYIVGYSTPFMYDDNGSYKLIVGSESGRLYFYDNIENNLTDTFNLVDTTYGDIDEGIRSAVAGADYNSDGYLDIYVGNYAGGLSFFLGYSLTSSLNPERTGIDFKLFPNPANSSINLHILGLPENKSYEITILNMLGKEIYRGSIVNRFSIIDVSYLNSGIYFLRINDNYLNTNKKFIIQR